MVTAGNLHRSKALIDVNTLLDEYTFWQPDESFDKQLALAVNERMAYIYLQDETIKLSDISSKLKTDSRIGFIAWKKGEISYVTAAGSDKPFTFSPNGPYTDPYRQSWELNGDPSILDLFINEQNKINYGDYPDALASYLYKNIFTLSASSMVTNKISFIFALAVTFSLFFQPNLVSIAFV